MAQIQRLIVGALSLCAAGGFVSIAHSQSDLPKSKGRPPAFQTLPGRGLPEESPPFKGFVIPQQIVKPHELPSAPPKPKDPFEALVNSLADPSYRFEPKRTALYRSVFRPMMNLMDNYSFQKTLFIFNYPFNPELLRTNEGIPERLDAMLSDRWPLLQEMGKSVGKFENINASAPATGTYLGGGVVLTAAHVGDLILPDSQSLIHWPNGETSACLKVVQPSPTEDIAFVIVSPPKGVNPLRNKLDFDGINLTKTRQVVAIGYPKLYGIIPFRFRQITTPGPQPIISPGLSFTIDESKAGFHDCATYYGSSGGPIIDGKTGMIVGVHSGQKENQGKSNFYTALTPALDLALKKN